MTTPLTLETQARVKLAAKLTLLIASDGAGVAGAAALTHGMGMIYAPAGWITGGALALGAAFQFARARRAAADASA